MVDGLTDCWGLGHIIYWMRGGSRMSVKNYLVAQTVSYHVLFTTLSAVIIRWESKELFVEYIQKAV